MGSFHGAEHLSERVQILFNTRNHFAFVGYTDRRGAQAARRGGAGILLKVLSPRPDSAWEWAPPSLHTHLPGSWSSSHSPWYEDLSLGSEKGQSHLTKSLGRPDQRERQFLTLGKETSNPLRANGADTALMYQVPVLAQQAASLWSI